MSEEHFLCSVKNAVPNNGKSIFSFFTRHSELFVTESIGELAKNGLLFFSFVFQISESLHKLHVVWLPVCRSHSAIFPLKTDFCINFSMFSFACLLLKKKKQIHKTWRDETVTVRKQGRKWTSPYSLCVDANVNIWTMSIINPNVCTLWCWWVWNDLHEPRILK